MVQTNPILQQQLDVKNYTTQLMNNMKQMLKSMIVNTEKVASVLIE